MYWITEKLDGTFDCSYRVQDGTERFTTRTRDEAIEGMRRAAWYGNHDEYFKLSDIRIASEVAVDVPASRVVQLVSEQLRDGDGPTLGWAMAGRSGARPYKADPIEEIDVAGPLAGDLRPGVFPGGRKALKRWLMRLADKL